MERLTDRGYKNRAFMKEPVLDEEQRMVDIIDRLAAYEDTGLEPEEIILAENMRHDCKIDCLLQKYNELADAVNDLGGLDHLRKLVQAEQEGRLAVLPSEDYTFRIRGDIALGIIMANCRAAREEAEVALKGGEG